MGYGAVLFDMDGVVIDTQSAVIAFWEIIAVRYHVELTQADFDAYIFGCPCRQTLDALFPHLTPEEREAVLTEERSYETSLTYSAMPGVINLLTVLRQHTIPTALVTSGERWKVAEVMRQIGIENLFTVYVTAEEIQRGKPDPACYLLAAQRLGTLPEHCLGFEDSISGVQAMVGAGVCCVGMRPSRTAPALLAEGACYVIPDFAAVRLEYGGNENLSLRITPDKLIPLRKDSR